MALTEIELARCKKELLAFLERRRPPAHLRDQVDISYRISGHIVEIFEIRPDWQDRSRRREIPVAKTTFVRTRNHWRVFWMRRDLKWHAYDPAMVPTFADVLKIVDRDEDGCFFG